MTGGGRDIGATSALCRRHMSLGVPAKAHRTPVSILAGRPRPPRRQIFPEAPHQRSIKHIGNCEIGYCNTVCLIAIGGSEYSPVAKLPCNPFQPSDVGGVFQVMRRPLITPGHAHSARSDMTWNLCRAIPYKEECANVFNSSTLTATVIYGTHFTDMRG